MSRLLRCVIALAFLFVTDRLAGLACAADALPAMQIVEVAEGVRFGIYGDKPAAPSPTLFVLAAGIEDLDKTRIYSETGRMLAADGWITVTVDLACHGRDAKTGEPPALDGWAHRVKAGQDLMGPFTERCRKVLDYLIAEGYTETERVAVCGTSRGGFSGLHFAAADPRVRVVTCVSPVTNPLALREFAGVTPEQVRTITASSLAEKLAGRAIQITIGNDDGRVSTDDCVAAARRFAAEGRKQAPLPALVPVELLVGPSQGHSAVEGAYAIAAEFIRKQAPKAKDR